MRLEIRPPKNITPKSCRRTEVESVRSKIYVQLINKLKLEDIEYLFIRYKISHGLVCVKALRKDPTDPKIRSSDSRSWPIERSLPV